MPDLKSSVRRDPAVHSSDHCCCHEAAMRALSPSGKLASEAPVSDRQRQVRVSVVVPTCGRPQLLQRCLASLVLQQFDPRAFEIIVVDDARYAQKSAGTCAVVTEWALHAAGHGPDIHYLAPLFDAAAVHGPAAARNRGWRSARGSVIAFTDDDTQARVDWLACGMAAFEPSPGEGAVPAESVAPAPAPADAVWGRITMPLHGPASDYELDAKGLEQAEFVTANCFCTRSLLERMDGFDEQFQLAWREDADLYFRLLDANARILHVPAAVVVHPIRPAGWGVSLTQQRKVSFDALLFKKHPRLYRQKIRGKPRWDYYAIVASLFLAIAGLIAGMPLLAAGALLFWVVQTGRFCLRRLRPAIKTPRHVIEMIVTSMLIPPLAVFWRIVGALRFRVGFL